jgi:hypothetical protein
LCPPLGIDAHVVGAARDGDVVAAQRGVVVPAAEAQGFAGDADAGGRRIPRVG